MSISDSYKELTILQYDSVFVYPFLFNDDNKKLVIQRLLSSPFWKPDFFYLDKKYDIVREYFFPNITQFFFPNSRSINISEQSELTNMKIKHLFNGDVCCRFKYIFNERITKDFKLLTNQVALELTLKRITLMIFSTGLCLLVFDVKLKSDKQIDINELVRMNKLFSNIRKGGQKTIPIFKFDSKKEFTLRELISLLIDSFNDLKPYNGYEFDVNHLLSYRFVSVKSSNGENCFDDNLYTKFKYNLDDSNVILPESDDTESKQWEVSRWSNTKFSFSRGGGVFYCHARDCEHAMKLKRDFRNYYLNMFLLAFFTRYSLLNSLWKISNTIDLINKYSFISQMRDKIIGFSNKYWFNEITESDYGQEIWKKWAKCLNLNTLHESVKSQLEELDHYSNQKRQDRYTFWGGMIAAIAIPFTLIFSYYGQNFTDFGQMCIKTAIQQTWKLVFLSVMAILLVFLWDKVLYLLRSIILPIFNATVRLWVKVRGAGIFKLFRSNYKNI